MTDASIILWGRRIGAVSWVEARALGIFQYDPAFVGAGIEVAPLKMPVREAPYEFPALPKETFKGLPGMLADALPDKFGNRLIDAWLAETGRSAGRFSPVDRLCYIGNRGIGALEFEPTVRKATRSKKLEVAQLVDLANRVLSERENLAGRLGGEDDAEALEDILSVGTSAGGARAKAVLAWNRDTGEFRSGQVKVDEGYEHWLLKFDGVSNNRDKELADPQGFGKIEYAYYLMATAAGIDMSECRLHHEGGRSHFMTRRFDRDERGRKVHMQSLGAMQHFDFNDPASYSYEQAIMTIRDLGLGMDVVEQQYKRAVFNIVARNQDDHVKNISFLMDRSGTWRLSPAYDVAYSYNPSGSWTRDHQMSLAGKRNDFTHGDLMVFASNVGLKSNRANQAIEEIVGAVAQWHEFAERAGVEHSDVSRIEKTFRMNLRGK
ncbi:MULTISPECIES: type II toxin-antitoxin system HipA family toxin [Alphaproteobacteria]|jgi:serine/threonine-protein kinase HipA|uniref:type II toxin-antitoxin system HipA family toxin n=1 Tax=Alphaproteobacteria TaxID=28211 RepID=UPI00237FB362|nr:type II toxin-antitoxin system HipA family toxin [Phaeobacter gallaeciensis]MDE4063703.1 type II toxin-antitoxin system HipA family toxin [Phaeobacter gallaeciensis]MDE4126722.1 type II toxin-antitoxin system HipA family toxin [Phaeobacter gallaeciensis]MDE4131192.1 type II toxin-antitoxin system HipA family toxin [Phaeobacter gallaeciensis]